MEAKQLAIDNTIMAIREFLMEYFKGSCGDKLALPSSVTVKKFPTSGNFYYERRESENSQGKVISIKNVPVMRVQLSPDTIVLFSKTLSRSKQMREVRDKLEMFLDKYLQGIEREHDENY